MVNSNMNFKEVENRRGIF